MVLISIFFFFTNCSLKYKNIFSKSYHCSKSIKTSISYRLLDLINNRFDFVDLRQLLWKIYVNQNYNPSIDIVAILHCNKNDVEIFSCFRFLNRGNILRKFSFPIFYSQIPSGFYSSECN